MINQTKPRFSAADIKRIQQFSRELTDQLDDFVSEFGMELSDREFNNSADISDEAMDFAFLQVMPIVTDMIIQTIKREI